MKFNFESWQEFLDWNVKRENHIKELEQHNYELEVENMKLKDSAEKAKHNFSKVTFYDTLLHASQSNRFVIEDNDETKVTHFNHHEFGQFAESLLDEYENATAENSDE